ncbi:A-kinase anchor protein 14-like [Halichondria panicea]|uniref:A-kinase anchor protein 14-like n=1 Tax=Halichondria panicea TaxID=6063 RepID=UPI00312B7B08
MTSNYRDYESEAHELIQHVLHLSVERTRQKTVKDVVKGVQKVEWPRGGEFTVEKGLEAIEKFVESWKIGESWKHCIDFLIQREKLYCYGVKWSEPTRRKAVPKATASVYFYLLVHSDDAPILVFYVVEGQRLVHRPENTVFHEVWLRNVVQNKLVIAAAATVALNE